MNLLLIISLYLFLGFIMPQSLLAHETWLLNSDTVTQLTNSQLPALFSLHNPTAFTIMIGIWLLLLGTHIFEQKYVTPLYRQFYPTLAKFALSFAPLMLRLGIGLILMYASVGGLPRHDMNAAGEPTLFVPDLNLMDLGGWYWQISKIEIVLALMLFAGFCVRFAAFGTLVLVAIGFVLFPLPMLDYAGHLVGPAVMLLYLGAGNHGTISSPYLTPKRLSDCLNHISFSKVYRFSMVLTGVTFMYLSVSKKMLAPNLLIAILERDHFPDFGMGYDTVVLIMAGIELFAGFYLMMGRLVRPVCCFILGAMIFFSFTLHEPFVIHSNIIAMLMVGMLYGDGEIITLGERKALWLKYSLPKFNKTPQSAFSSRYRSVF